jgi:5'-3' exonuclease
MNEPSNLLLVDLSHIFRTFWHVSEHEDLSKAFQLTMDMVRTLSSGAESGTDYTAICIDSPPYWRKEVYPGYKAQRAETPPQVHGLLDKVKDRLRADGYLMWAAPGFEADDVIAWACKQAEQDPGIGKVVIASSDKDLHQLVGGKVTCYSPMNRATFDAAAVVEKHGVEPRHMLDYLSLVGDASDNVPGVPGVGPKTAAALMNTFGSLEAVLAEAALNGESKITKPALKKALVEHADAARLAKKLIALRTDLPLDWADLRAERKAVPLVETNGDAMDAEFEEQPPSAKSEPPADLPPVKPVAAAAPIVIRQPDEWSLALEPRSSKGAYEVAGALYASKLYSHLPSQDAIYAVMLRGRALGLDATTALASFHSIQGRLAMHADLIEALVLRSGKAEYFEMDDCDAKQATYVTKRVGGRRAHSMTFTIEDAFNAKLVVKDPSGIDGYNGRDKTGAPSADSNWSKWRATMLRHRAKTQLARAVYSDLVLGLYDPEELEG